MQKKFIFISIPKNASITIHKLFGIKQKDRSNKRDVGIFDNHARCEIIKKRYGEEEFDGRFKFCFVRNPWDRCVSWFFFHKRLKPYRYYSFAGWIKADMPHHWKIQNGTDYIKEKISPLEQYVFIYDKQGNKMIDYIGKVENLDDDLKYLLKRGYMKRTNGHRQNKSSRRSDYRKYYTRETKNIVANQLKKDIQLFNYKFY